jgi:hypothetical protein
MGVLLQQVGSAGAVPRPTPPAAPPQVRGNTEMGVTGSSPGQGVTGYIADSSNPFDPATDPYPPSDPTTGWTSKNEGFAGLTHGMPAGGGMPLNLYCIDINTDTTVGIGYVLGSWDAGGVSPRVGYVARLLNDYYPHTNEPATLTDLNQKAAAVQAAIWFFSDRYMLSTADPLHDAVVAIVNDVKSKGPLVQPPPPTLTITPPSKSGPAGTGSPPRRPPRSFLGGPLFNRRYRPTSRPALTGGGAPRLGRLGDVAPGLPGRRSRALLGMVRATGPNPPISGAGAVPSRTARQGRAQRAA